MRIRLAANGAFLGVALAYVAIRSIIKFTEASSALRKIKDSPFLRVSGVRSVLSPSEHFLCPFLSVANGSGSSNDSEEGKLVIVHGLMEAKSAVDWSLRPDVVVPHKSGYMGIILQRTQRVPFVLVEGGKWQQNDYLVVNMDGSRHPFPLVTVFNQLDPVTASAYAFLRALFGHEYAVGMIGEEKILPLGKDITAVGICSLKDGVAEIKSCNDLPYFLSDMSKDQMVIDIAFMTKVWWWSGVVFGTLSIGILGYAVVRNWNRWKVWRQQRQAQQQNNNVAREDADPEIATEERTRDILDGELCAICLTRRKLSAFVPCGHWFCCLDCALSVERELEPKCPVCREFVWISVRIYDS